QLLEQLQCATFNLDITKQNAKHSTAGLQRRNSLAPCAAVAGEVLFTEKVEDHSQIAAALAVVVNQQDFGFTPHLIGSDSRAGNEVTRYSLGQHRQLATSKVKNQA